MAGGKTTTTTATMAVRDRFGRLVHAHGPMHRIPDNRENSINQTGVPGGTWSMVRIELTLLGALRESESEVAERSRPCPEHLHGFQSSIEQTPRLLGRVVSVITPCTMLSRYRQRCAKECMNFDRVHPSRSSNAAGLERFDCICNTPAKDVFSAANDVHNDVTTIPRL